MLKSTRKIFIIAALGVLPLKNYAKENKNLFSHDKSDTTAILLNEITISAGLKNIAKSPLRIKSVDSKLIDEISAGKTYPELLSNIPGIYASSETGSYGDAKINIRGFKQENISVLLNGVPISGLTSGSMFWNNWLGLTDATSTIQVQKGIGGSMLSDNSVGGTINIITKSPSKEPLLNIGYSFTGSGLSKGVINFNSGVLPKGWAISVLASYTGGKGWVDKTNVNSWAYMATISKQFKKGHSLLFSALGSPEEHEQRTTRLTYNQMKEYGRDYNKNWGMFTRADGTKYARTISKNNYHKPYFTLNHFYNTKIGKNARNFSMSNAIYLTIGDGGGYWTETKGKRIIDYIANGQIDWDAVVSNNIKENNSQNIMSDYMAGHTQWGVKSSIEMDLSDNFKMEAGMHFQHYSTWEKEKITDLLGGDYWYEDYEKNSLAGLAGRNPIKYVGDYIRTNNGKILNYGTIYSMFTYDKNNLILKLGGSLSGSTHKRWDKYNYINDIYSKVAVGGGGAVKFGLLYKISNSQSFYINSGFYTRAPYSSVYFASGNNQISKDVKNEKNILAETGYRLIYGRGGIEATLYAAYWMNKSMMSNPYKPLEEDTYRFMISGLNALHYGVEADVWYNFTNWFKFNGYASIGSWRWKNNVNANIYDPYSGLLVQQINVYSKGLPVGDSPQTQIGASLEIKPYTNLRIFAQWQYNGRYWADFEPSTRTTPDDYTNPYRIPSYNIINIGAGWDKKLSKRLDINLFANINNLFDTYYIERGKDGKTHSQDTFTGYWGVGRNYNIGIKLKFR